MKKSTKILCRIAIISALYAVLSLVAFPIASGQIQVRLGEGLTLLPLFFMESSVGLFIGCFIVNLITGTAILDTVFGSLITLISAILTHYICKKIKKVWLKIFIGGLFPVLLNAFLLPLIWKLCYGVISYGYIISALFVLAGQVISVYGIGTGVTLSIKKLRQKNLEFFK